MDITNKEKLTYNRECDDECHSCGRMYYSQPYDKGNKVNLFKKQKNCKNCLCYLGGIFNRGIFKT
jgi:hypothetical protein